MLPSLVLKKESDALVEDPKKIPVQTRLMKDHRLLVLIHHPQGDRDRDKEITVQDLMINPRTIIYSLFQPIPKKIPC